MCCKTIRLVLLPALAGILLGTLGCTRHARSAKHLQRADEHFAAGRYDQAEIEYKNALQLDGSNIMALGRLGRIYQEEGRSGQAVPFLKKATELQPENFEARDKLALALLTLGQAGDAAEAARYVLDRRPADAEAPLVLAESALTAQEREAARARLQRLPAPVATRAPVLIALGQLELRENHAAAAERLFVQAHAADPNSPEALVALAMLAWARQDVAAADQAFQQALAHAALRSACRLQYIQFKIQTGDSAGAKRMLDAINRDVPDYIPAWIWRADLALADKDYDTAEAILTKVIARDRVHPDVLLLGARIAFARHQPDRAIDVLSRMVTVYPQSALAYYQLGLAFNAKSDFNAAAENFRHAVALDGKFVPAVLDLAQLEIQSGDYNAALVRLKPIVDQFPDQENPRLMLGEAYRGNRDWENAGRVFADVERRFPKDGRAPYLLGIVLRQANRPDAARQAFLRAQQIQPDLAGPTEQLIDMDLAEKRFAPAQKQAELAIARSPRSAAPLVLLAKVHVAQGDLPAAATALQRAIALQPAEASPYLLLARVYVGTSELKNAIADLQRLLAQNPRNVEALTMNAVLLDAQRDVTGARDGYEKLLAVAPDSTIALNNLAYIYSEHTHELDKAYELAQRARTLQPQEPRTADTLGWILYRRHDYARAVALLQESAAKLPDDAEVQFHLGMTFYMLGREIAAQETLTHALHLTPPPATSGEAEQRIAFLKAIAAGAIPSVLAQAVAKDPSDPVALVRLSQLRLEAKQLPPAREAAEAAYRSSPQNPSAAAQLARVCAAQGEANRAMELAKSARSLAPDDATITHLLGRLGYEARQFGWAAGLLREAADGRPDDPDALLDCGLAAYSVGDVTTALNFAQRALQAAPAFARGAEARQFIALARYAADAGTNPPADLDALLKRDPANVPAWMARATLAAQQHDMKTARDAYEHGLKLFPDFAPAQKALATLYAAQSIQSAEALQTANKARLAYPADADVAKALGILVYRDGQFLRASRLLDERIAAQPNDGEALYYLGMCQYQLKRTAESKRTLQRALQVGLEAQLEAQARKSLASLD